MFNKDHSLFYLLIFIYLFIYFCDNRELKYNRLKILLEIKKQLKILNEWFRSGSNLFLDICVLILIFKKHHQNIAGYISNFFFLFSIYSRENIEFLKFSNFLTGHLMDVFHMFLDPLNPEIPSLTIGLNVLSA